MLKLNFPECELRFRNDGRRISVFDEIRRKFVILTPEEWVRQHCIRFLLSDKKYPKSLVNVEKNISLNGTVKRYDAVVFQPDGKINILVECKAPEIAITQSVFDQIARYNLALNANYLMVTNGLNHYFCRMDHENSKYEFLAELPDYDLEPSISTGK